MPFTLSHPAAVLPLIRGGRGRGPLVATALVLGSMAPDVPYFAGAWVWGNRAHTWVAVPTLDVLIAGSLAAVWYLLLRRPLLGLLPARWAAAADRLTAPREGGLSAPRAAWFALSAAIGAATHVFWDGFTHPGRFGARLFPVIDSGHLLGSPVYAVLQYGCSAAVVPLLAWSVWRALRGEAARQPAADTATTLVPPHARRLAWTLVPLAALLGAVYRYLGWARPGQALTVVLPVVGFGAVAGACAALLLYALLCLRRG